MRNRIGEIFKIDKLGNPWLVRILFAFLAIMKCAIEVLPIGDKNFDEFFAYVNSILNNPDADSLSVAMNNIPITRGNIIFIISSLLVELIILCAGYFYAGQFIRKVRQLRGMNNYISHGKFACRLFVLCLLTIILSLPLAFVLLYLSLIFIIIFPCLIILPACYLSGDSSLLQSFRDCVKRTKGYYIINARNLSTIFLLNMAVQFVLFLLSNASPMVAMVVQIFVGIYTCFVIFRYVGIVYTRMIDVPGNIILVQRPVEMPDDDGNNDDK